MPHLEVDQSGRVEMSGTTIVALSNHAAITVRITASVKQEVQQELRRRGVKPRLVMVRLFVAAILLALASYPERTTSLMIDEEYLGYEAEIKSLLIDRAQRLDVALTRDNIHIARVGKKSPAHKAAIQVTRGQTQATTTPTAEELLALC
ncbi:MAG: hypothetical protein IAE85_08830 [Anaerolinea sp.]|nr:hypothetical protein [Anaerolinea sp.]